MPAGGWIVIDSTYNSESFIRGRYDLSWSAFQNVAGGIVTNPTAELGELEMISGAERRQLLFEIHSTGVEWREMVRSRTLPGAGGAVARMQSL